MKKASLIIPAVVISALVWVMLADKSPVAGVLEEGGLMSETQPDSASPTDQPHPGQVDDSSVASEQEQQSADESRTSDRFETPQQVLREVVADNGINQRAAEQALRADGFHELTVALRSQTLTPEESMRNEEFKAFVIEYAAAANDDVTYDEMECGKSVCALSFRTQGGDAGERFYKELTSDETHRTYAVVGWEADDDGIQSLRLLVSIDPDVKSIVVPAPK